MPKKKRPHRRHKNDAARTRRRRQDGRSRHLRIERSGPPDLRVDVRRALSEEHPLGLLGLVSSMLAITDLRRQHPFERKPDDQHHVSREELVQSFIGVPVPETSALLAVTAEMIGDDLLRARIRRALDSRTDPLPAWIRTLPDVAVYRAVEMVHVLGDGDNVMLGVRMADGHELTCVVYIDHNMGTLVKDAFVVPDSIENLIRWMRTQTADADTSWNDIDLADARTRVQEAIDRAAITVPQFETDTWPACRALLEWVSRRLPEGGRGYQRPEWDESQLAELTDRFFASSYAAGLDDEDNRGLLESLLWFGTGYGPGDPLRWSPISVEIVLTDWIPRKIVADVAYLSKAPQLLRAFIKFCHAERGIRKALTKQTVAAVDRWEPEYQRVIRTPRLQGAAALLASIGALDPDEYEDLDDDFDEDASIEEIMLEALRLAVGGDDRLVKLDDAPLPDEPFAYEGIADDIRDSVAEILALVDRCCDELLDVEYRTACRRFFARAAVGDPNVFRRAGRTDTAAAAIVWIIGKANNLFSPYFGGLRVKDLMSYFGFKQTSVSQRASTLLRAGGFEVNQDGAMNLGSPDFLTSPRRRQIMELRDRYRQSASAQQGPA